MGHFYMSWFLKSAYFLVSNTLVSGTLALSMQCILKNYIYPVKFGITDQLFIVFAFFSVILGNISISFNCLFYHRPKTLNRAQYHSIPQLIITHSKHDNAVLETIGVQVIAVIPCSIQV